MCVFDTEENQRAQYTERTLISLEETVDFFLHRIIIFDNGSCQQSRDNVEDFCTRINAKFAKESFRALCIRSEENLGTAAGINECWNHRFPEENCIKLDNDVEFYHKGWVDEMEAAIDREPRIGIVALKRKDLTQSPWHEDPSFKSELVMLPHAKGEPWIVIENVKNGFGTCQMYSAELLDRIGYLIQVGPYGWDDHLSDVRCLIAGKWTCFLPHIEIDHIDTGGTEYTEWKVKQADAAGPEVSKLIGEYKSGIRDIYYDGGFTDVSNS